MEAPDEQCWAGCGERRSGGMDGLDGVTIRVELRANGVGIMKVSSSEDGKWMVDGEDVVGRGDMRRMVKDRAGR